jgi:hypothetical protein
MSTTSVANTAPVRAVRTVVTAVMVWIGSEFRNHAHPIRTSSASEDVDGAGGMGSKRDKIAAEAAKLRASPMTGILPPLRKIAPSGGPMNCSPEMIVV